MCLGGKNFLLPDEIQFMIWSFDPTGKELFDKTLHQIQFIPVLQEIKYYFYTNETNWRKDIYDFKKAFHNPTWIVHMIRNDNWKRFRQELFLKNIPHQIPT
jgi:hypothetical protein